MLLGRPLYATSFGWNQFGNSSGRRRRSRPRRRRRSGVGSAPQVSGVRDSDALAGSRDATSTAFSPSARCNEIERAARAMLAFAHGLSIRCYMPASRMKHDTHDSRAGSCCGPLRRARRDPIRSLPERSSIVRACRLHEFVFLSNHYHMLATWKRATSSRSSSHYLNGNIAAPAPVHSTAGEGRSGRGEAW